MEYERLVLSESDTLEDAEPGFIIDGILKKHIKSVIEAERELIIRGIKANAVIINPELFYTRVDFHGMLIEGICGLKVHYTTKDLPEDVMFMVCRTANHEQGRIEELEEENKTLRNKLDEICELLFEG